MIPINISPNIQKFIVGVVVILYCLYKLINLLNDADWSADDVSYIQNFKIGGLPRTPEEEDVDCTWKWSDCTSECELAQERQWIQITAPSGDGKGCPYMLFADDHCYAENPFRVCDPLPTNCEDGDGLCGAPPIYDSCSLDQVLEDDEKLLLGDCPSDGILGHTESCSLACPENYLLVAKEASKTVFTVDQLQPTCNNGNLLSGVTCKPEDIDCVGEWSTCAADCSDATYTVSVPSSGTGAACEAEDGATQTCSPGQGNCPLNTDCVGSCTTPETYNYRPGVAVFARAVFSFNQLAAVGSSSILLVVLIILCCLFVVSPRM